MNYDAVEHAIDSLNSLVDCFERDGKYEDAWKTKVERTAWLEVLARMPRNDGQWHRMEDLSRYCDARIAAENMAGIGHGERETQP